MRIIWNNDRFEAEFSEFKTDLESVKSAGFRTDGPPQWTWHTTRVQCLNYLRKNRPQSGLIITEVALQKFNKLNEAAEQKAALKKQFKDANKKAKKESKDPTVSGLTELVIPEGKIWISVEDLPPGKPFEWGFVRPNPPEDRCMICEEPIYMYEHLVCLWCEKESENNA
jgi:predicted type IV restriction endonuclease